MADAAGDLAREHAFFLEALAPIVRRLLASAEPWDAYDAVLELRAEMFDELAWLPHGGEVFAAWADLEDLYDLDRTPVPDAHAALRAGAADWLDRPADGPSWDVEGWITRVNALVQALARRDGTFWHAPKPDSPKLEWLGALPAGPPLRDELARLVEEVGGQDQAENG